MSVCGCCLLAACPHMPHLSSDYDLGRLQSGERLGDVLLPKWAATPEDFIRTHREALVREREKEGEGAEGEWG